MSHFLTFVIVSRAEADVAQKAHDLLFPYFDRAIAANKPRAKCDAFIIGGRFDQEIYGVEPMYDLTPDEFEQRYGMDVVKAENNIRPAAEVPKGLVPYAVVTPEGEWFDCENRDKERWRVEAEALLQRYANYLVVAMDCHC
jgi:sensor domain CHASE-containing protein